MRERCGLHAHTKADDVCWVRLGVCSKRRLPIRVHDLPSMHEHHRTTGFLECPISDTRFYYAATKPPQVNTFRNPEGRKIVDAARYAYYGSTRSHTRAGKLTANARKLMKHVTRWDNSAANGQRRRRPVGPKPTGDGLHSHPQHTRHQRVGLRFTRPAPEVARGRSGGIWPAMGPHGSYFDEDCCFQRRVCSDTALAGHERVWPRSGKSRLGTSQIGLATEFRAEGPTFLCVPNSGS